MKHLVFICFCWLSLTAVAQTPLAQRPISTESEEGFSACTDTVTIRILRRHQEYDLGIILPSWLPIVHPKYVGVLEGKVAFNPSEGYDGPFVAHEDLPFYHYSHDFNFDVIPDRTDDNRYTNLLPFMVYKKAGGYDTVLPATIHCEWETGLGMANFINPLRFENEYGRSGGFFSEGHEKGDLIWNWPSAGDWVHAEGHYVWDRGHPPSRAELHPLRFLAIRRALPERLIIGDSSVKFATRVDIFASGDGGALMNNRHNAPRFVQRVNMSSKDYEFIVKMDLPRPSPKARLRYNLLQRKGDTFSVYETVELNDDSAFARIVIPWKTANANDLEVYARTIHLYWDEGKGVAQEVPVDVYKVKFTNLRFKHLNEKMGYADVRLFANVGSDWIFLNDYHERRGKILTRGLGRTRKKKWELNNEFTVYVPRGKNFRVYMSGWENDGIDRLFGKLLDPGSPCNRKTKHFFRNAIFSVWNMLFKGCMDDEFGEISRLHSYDKLGATQTITNSPQQGRNDDPCPGEKFPLKDRYFLTYTIEKVN